MPLAKTQDDASLKDLRLRRFDESALPRTLIASARIASIRRCSLENVCAPTDSKNWLGRSTSGSGFSRPSSEAAFLESFCIANLDLVVFRHIAVDTPAPSVSSCPATILNLTVLHKSKGLKVCLSYSNTIQRYKITSLLLITYRRLLDDAKVISTKIAPYNEI